MKQARHDDRFSIGKTHADFVRKTTTWSAVLAVPTLAYLGISFYLVGKFSPAVRVFGLNEGYAETLLLDLIIVAAPLCVVLAGYLMRLKQHQRKERQVFVAAFDADDLVRSRYNRNLVYRVIERDDDGAIRQMQVVWTPQGRCQAGKVYEGVDALAVIPFVQDDFLSPAN